MIRGPLSVITHWRPVRLSSSLAYSSKLASSVPARLHDHRHLRCTSISHTRTMSAASPVSTTAARLPATSTTSKPSMIGKTIIVCCDGTWQSADSGYTKPSLIPYRPAASLQDPSNVTRLSRALDRADESGRPQIVYYQAGVGSTGSFMDHLTGGVLGLGVSENIREAYSFITTNYKSGDDIILIGFSRGAFTARSVAGMIKDIGLLTREGMDSFYPIFRDYENSENPKYHDLFPIQPFPNKPTGENKRAEYKQRLLESGLTRVSDPGSSKPIGIKAVAVWDTVGSLGFPHISWWDRLHLPHASTKELQFHDTSITSAVKYAFQALALDESRGPFSPAVWERDENCTTDLRQVWFPGSHANVGGGCEDQGMANVTLAWMMDQLASIGVKFQDDTLDLVYQSTEKYYKNLKKSPTWANKPVYDKFSPVRPWSLGNLYRSYQTFWYLAGQVKRSPGLYLTGDPKTGKQLKLDSPDKAPLTRTNERIHSSVRARIDLGGLNPGDSGPYTYSALQGNWEKRKTQMKFEDPIKADASWGGPGVPDAKDLNQESRWVWEYIGPKNLTPLVDLMVEDNLGPYERKLLSMSAGLVEDVFLPAP